MSTETEHTTPCHDCPDPGMCCRYVVLPLARTLSGDERKWVELHEGLSIREDDTGTYVRVDVPCSALAPDGKCELFGTPLRPRLCNKWPDNPAVQVTSDIEGCLYAT